MSHNHVQLAAKLSQHGIAGASFAAELNRFLESEAPRLRRLWSYYRNPMRALAGSDESSARPYTQAQEWGLPRRITGDVNGSTTTNRREVVIENDIAWRLDTMVDFLFGQPIVLLSAADDANRREIITRLLRRILANHGGLSFLQQLALTGAIYGHVDVLVKLLPEAESIASATITTQDLGANAPEFSTPMSEQSDDSDSSPPESSESSHLSPGPAPRDTTGESSPQAINRLAGRIRLEVVEPARALPLLRDLDYSVIEAYALVQRVASRETASGSANRQTWFQRLFTARGFAEQTARQATLVELIAKDRWINLLDDRIVAHGNNSLGEIPVVHIQNIAAPFSYCGASDLEPLMPLQDELNTRLSDRAHRITMQSFRMYLGKGIDNFGEQVVAPGRMWMSENPDAEIIEFGGDSACPSEDAHIREIREAMDKQSGVSPIAAGALKNRIGRLTSAAALRVTLLSLLARTQRKRVTYGNGIARICELALKWLDHAGLFKTTEDERQIEIHWPNPIPLNEAERLEEARLKRDVGVPLETVLKELGYHTPPPGAPGGVQGGGQDAG
jgi:hypothetical protein